MLAALALVRWTIAAAATVAAIDFARAAEPLRAEDEPAHLHCLTMAQARSLMESHKLANPFHSMREAAIRLSGEPLGARLCELGETLLYEISLLRADGRIVKILVDAVTGRPHSGHAKSESGPHRGD